MHFFCKLVAPRSTFLRDMTDAERGLMGEHAAYWREWMGRGNIIAFGVVADPAGVFGAGMVEFDDFEQVKAFADADPTVRSRSGFSIEIHPMPFGVVHP